MTQSRLEILLLEETDHFATYSCTAFNSEGTAKDEVEIELIEKQPTVYDSSKETEVETRMELWDEFGNSGINNKGTYLKGRGVG